MSQQTDGTQIQGQRADAVFGADSYAALYAAEGGISGLYDQSSRGTALQASALLWGGLRGKRVLDVGCGCGATLLALINHVPGSVTCLDNSPGMIAFLEMLFLSDRDIEESLRAGGVHELLPPDLFAPTVEYFARQRRRFKASTFAQCGGKVETKLMSSLDITSENLGTFDVVVGNNFIHWPVNSRKAELKKLHPDWSDEMVLKTAIDDALRPLSSVLDGDGVLVLMEPKNFVVCDDDPVQEKQCADFMTSTHPLYKKFQLILNERIQKRYGVQRAVPKSPGMFQRSQIPAIFREHELDCVDVAHEESVTCCDVPYSQLMRVPMVLGAVDAPFADKMRMGREAVEELRRTATEDELKQPLYSQNFYICAYKE